MDGPPAQSLGVEPVDPSVMGRPPRPKQARVLTKPLIQRVLTQAAVIMLGTLAIYVHEMGDADSTVSGAGKTSRIVTAHDTTMTFTCFVLFDMFNALSCRSEGKSILRGEISLKAATLESGKTIPRLGGTDEHFKVITAIVREAGPRFVYFHEGFVARVLKAARSVGRTTHRDLSSAIFAASVSGVRSGAPGQPFHFDLELKAMSEQRLALLAKSDPTFDLYRELRDYAVREIERQLEEGRRMDEEDADT